jgi:glucoamylase
MNAPTRTPISRLFYALTILVAASALIIYMANSGPTHVAPRLSFSIDKQTPVDEWLEYERPLALNGIVDNIGPSGSKATGARRGVVIASPSKWNPDYFYTWTRDSALTIAALMDEIVSDLTRELLGTVHDCILAQRSLQRRTNPSGNLTTGGLGEAKFNVDLTAFTGDWGRPQRDGPALRAIAVSKYARHMFSKDSTNTANALIWPDIIEPDLSYVKKNWNVSTFDLWEEVKGFSFFTTAMQYRSLVQGDRLAREIGRDCDECISQAGQVLDFLQTYWNGTNIIANTAGGRSGKDLNSILASVHMFEPEHGCDAVTFQPCSDRALANHKVVTDSFRSVYAINKEFPAGVGVAVGRYPEDIYMGGNPWFVLFEA